jgi:2-keto-4-pentenoate hydratase/2-oxohepta-3-ene-1,7-dioic acid hydratase in catechol pathway
MICTEDSPDKEFSSFLTFCPGDIISSAFPGLVPLADRDSVEIEIEGIRIPQHNIVRALRQPTMRS